MKQKQSPHQLIEITKKDWEKKSRRSFLVAALAFIGGAAGLWIAQTSEQEDFVPWPFRRVLSANESIWRKLFRANTTAENPPAPTPGTPARLNSNIGMEDPIDLKSWRLEVLVGSSTSTMSFEDLTKFRQVEHTEVFKCVEGWSQTISYRGISFQDFMSELKIQPQDFNYVSLETPDSNYYVSLDIESMLHPKTLLATEMNGLPLSGEHGAPLRLIVPVKYGIKNLKRIGKIAFEKNRPPDYWAEQGYDWYAGL